jgi:exosortase
VWKAAERLGWPPRDWLLAAVAVTGLAAFIPLFKTLVAVAAKHPYAGHVVFVPILAVVLIWLERHRFRGLVDEGHASGAVLAVLALPLVAVGYRAASLPVQALSFVAVVAGLALFLLGPRGVRASGFALVFLLFMIPPPRDAIAALAPVIQHTVAAFSAGILYLLQIPAVHEGVHLRLPGLTLVVAEECAGLRFALILFTLAIAFSRAVVPTRSGQLVLVSLAIPVAMLANAIRVAVTSVGVYAIGPHVATGPLHYFIGKSIWVLALLVIVGIAGLLRARAKRALGGRRSGACLAAAP